MANELGVEPVEIASGKYLSVSQAIEVLQVTQQSICQRIQRRNWPGKVIEIPLHNRRKVLLLDVEGVRRSLEEQESRGKRRGPRPAEPSAVEG